MIINPYLLATGAISASTWNSADKGADLVLSNGNLTITPGAAMPGSYESCRSTNAKSAGKLYFEVRCDVAGASNYGMIGVADSAMPTYAGGTSYPGGGATGWGYYEQTGDKYHLAAATPYGSAFVAGNIIGVAVDLGAGLIWFSLNGAWQASGSPSAGTGAAFSGLTGSLFPAIGIYGISGSTFTARFISSSQTYSPPTGFSAWG